MDNFGIAPLRTLHQLNNINTGIQQTTERISTGKTVNRASDSPSTYFIAKTLERDVALGDTQSRIKEREQNATRTQSNRLDTAADIAGEIDDLAASASDPTLSQGEKDALQNQATQMAQHLDNVLQDAGVGTAADLGLDASQIKLNGSESDRAQTAASAKSGFTNLLTQNENEGSTFRTRAVQLQHLAQQGVDLKATLSTVRDADLAQESITLNGQSILQNVALKSLVNAQAQQQSVLSLFG